MVINYATALRATVARRLRPRQILLWNRLVAGGISWRGLRDAPANPNNPVKTAATQLSLVNSVANSQQSMPNISASSREHSLSGHLSNPTSSTPGLGSHFGSMTPNVRSNHVRRLPRPSNAASAANIGVVG